VDLARLFAVVEERFPHRGFYQPGDRIAVLTLASGAVLDGRVEEETPRGISLRQPDGSAGTIPADQIVKRVILSGDAGRRALDEEYRRRLAAVREPRGPALLDLAGWCVARGLRNHLPFLLDATRRAEQASDRPVMGPFLVREYAKLGSADQEEVSRVLRRFYAPSVREVLVADAGPTGEEDVASRSGGTGSMNPVPRTPRRKLDEDFLSRADRAKELIREGEKHYRKAMPDMPNRAMHRDKAKKLLVEARDILEVLTDERPDQRWLERHLKACYEMLYWLRKDSPVR
jgi:hypothetical protein